MAGYTTVNERIIDGILSLYGNESVSEWVAMTHGISNSNFKIITHSKKELLLKISNDKTFEQLQEELEILSQLKLNNYAHSIAAYQTKAGNHVFGYESYFGVLFPFVYGQAPQVSSSTCSQLGRALAKLHSTQVCPSIRSYQEIGQDFSNIQAYTGKIDHQEKNLAKSTFQKSAKFFFYKMNFDAFKSQELPIGIIHGDLYYDNTLFQDGELKHVLDFEQAGHGRLLLDIGISISGSCLKLIKENQSEIDHALIKEFLQGYQSIRPLTQLELENLNQSIILGLLSVSLWRVIRFNEKQIAQNKEESFKELLKRAHSFYDSL